MDENRCLCFSDTSAKTLEGSFVKITLANKKFL